MKEEQVKIMQISVYPYGYFTSNGSMYKDETNAIFGLGDDGKIYKWGKHTIYNSEKRTCEDFEGWRYYIPN